MAVRIEKLIYGGSGLARADNGETLQIPFTLPGETVDPDPLRILEPSPHRVAPRCSHFGVCGGCHYQHVVYDEQLRLKREILSETMQRAGVIALPEITAIAGDPWHYRNRIRLRLGRVDGLPRAGYSVRSTNTFLPIVECPIAAPLLWRSVEAFLQLAAEETRAAAWFDTAAEAEFFTDALQQKVLLTLHCRTQTSPRNDTFVAVAQALQSALPELTGAAALRTDARSGRTLEVLAEWGTQGIAYNAAGETYWISRGGFFQVNRFLIDAMVHAVCNGRRGLLAWDLFAGVGLFSRVLARSFARVTAVEANPTAASDLRIALRKLGPAHQAIQQTTVDFLSNAVLQRDRADLIVLDPPRAGAGAEVCTLLGRLRPAQLVYVSCDPTTLARDLQHLQTSGYRIDAMQLIELFPQTFHIETIVALSLA